jgi:Cu(I)/Ag(I) efflux system membrane fusion protein
MNKIISILILSSFVFAFNLEQNFNIKTHTVQKQNIANYKEFYGKTKLDIKNIHTINLRFDGFITKLYANKEYAYIKKGDKLFNVYSKEIYNLFDELNLAKNSSSQIYQSVVNKFRLYNISVNSKTDDSINFRSDYSGYIMKHNLQDGAFVKKGASLLELADITSLWGIINVYQKDINYIKKNMEVELSFDGVDKKYNTKIEAIYPNIEPQTQTFGVKVNINNEDETLKPNMFFKAKIYEENKSILFIPKNALIQRDGKTYVFFKEGKMYSPSEVSVKPILNGYEVLDGLGEGDVIVKNVLFLLDSDALTNSLYNDDW